MRIVIFSDVHGNVLALDAVLAHIRREAAPDALFVAFGHYHVPFVRQLDQWTLVDVASVGMPRDGDRRAVYAVLTWEGAGWRIEHRRVPFDMEAVARDYAAVGYPDAQQAAERLLAA